MATSDLRDALQSSLLEHLRETRYPSPTMMDRCEANIRDMEHAREYADVLIGKIAADRYPSGGLIDRVNAFVDLIDSAEAAQQMQSRR